MTDVVPPARCKGKGRANQDTLALSCAAHLRLSEHVRALWVHVPTCCDFDRDGMLAVTRSRREVAACSSMSYEPRSTAMSLMRAMARAAVHVLLQAM